MTDDGLSHSEIQELLGAYALGAVDETERAAIDAHLESCASCRDELREHRRLAETLRRHATRVSPLASAESNGFRNTNGDVEPPGPIRRWNGPIALAITVVMLTGVFTQAQLHFNHLEASMDHTQLLERAQLATTSPSAVVTALRTPSNDPVLTVVSLAAGGASFAINSTLPPLADGQIYKLWSAGSRGVSATAELGRRPHAVMFFVPSGVTEFLLTVEHHPAASRPTLPAVGTGHVSPSQP